MRVAYDCRLLSDFYSHPKTRRLLREHGAEGVVALQRLWLYATEYEPSGVFAGSSRELLADATGLANGGEDFIDHLVSIGLLDVDEEGTYAIHNWARRNPYCVHRDEIRAQKSRAGKASATKKRADRIKKDAQKIKRKRNVTNKATSVQQMLEQPFQPHPIPSQPKSERDTLSHSLARGREGERAREIFFALVHAHIPLVTMRDSAAWTRELQKLLDAGETVEGLQVAMGWALQNEFWSTRILSPQSFSKNYAIVLAQMRQSTGMVEIDDVPANKTSMTEAEWEKLKQKWKEEKEKENSEPP